MAKFFTGNDLNSEMGKLFEAAEEQIILISPFIKLHDHYASILQAKKDKPKIQIIIVFGKNEKDLSKSMKEEDFNFFKEFPNIEIHYEKRLHAKYYSNETTAILTSMNLYDYSQDHNIEAGVLTAATTLGKLATKFWNGEEGLDETAWKYFERVITQSKTLFKKVPQFDKGIIGTGLNKKYLSSTIETDLLTDFFANRQKYDTNNVKENNEKKPEEVTKRVVNKPVETQTGYCIRTGVSIPFSLEKPMTDVAWKSWSKYSDPNYAEKYCHFSGELSNKETSVKRPILNKNWKKAKETFNL